jgi:heat shock protein HtpX
MNGLYPQPAIFENFVRIVVERPTFIVEGQYFPYVFNVILAALQVGLLIGAVRLMVTAMMSSPDQTGEAAAGIDGRRLRRPWWHTPVAMTFSIIISLYAIVWGVLLLTQRPGAPLRPFGLAFQQAGSIPLYLGLAFGVLGFLWGSRFNASARARIASKAGVHHLADTHWLTQRVHALAARLDLPPPAVGVMNAVNAYASGSSPEDAAVVLGVPLINGLSDDELDAVIGHELGHIVSGDMRRMQYAVGYQRMFGTILATISTAGIAVAARRRSGAEPFLRICGIVARYTFAIGSEMMTKGLSRSREYYADAIGASVSSPEAMAGALRKVATIRAAPTPAENQFAYMMFKGGRRSNVFSTHPTTARRCAALESRTHLKVMPLKRAGSPD